jgi:hypothetical protein
MKHLLGVGIILAVLLLSGCVSQPQADVSPQAEADNTPAADYGDPEDYLLSESDVGSANFNVEKTFMRTTLSPRHGSSAEAFTTIRFLDSDIEYGYGDIPQIVRIFSSSSGALDHFDDMKAEQLGYDQSPDYEIDKTEYSSSIGDRSYAFNRVTTTPTGIVSNMKVLFVKKNVYIEITYNSGNVDYYPDRFLQLGEIVANKI